MTVEIKCKECGEVFVGSSEMSAELDFNDHDCQAPSYLAFKRLLDEHGSDGKYSFEELIEMAEKEVAA